MRRVPLFVVALLGSIVWVGPALAQAASSTPTPSPSPAAGVLEWTDHAPDQVVLSGNVNVRKGEVVGEVVVLHGSVEIAGLATGDVIVVDGHVRITGQVSGTVIAANGSVELGPNAQVGESVRAHGTVTQKQGAKVGGTVTQHASFSLRGPLEAVAKVLAWLAVSISALALGFVLLLLAPRGADAVADAARTAPWASVGWGLGAAIGLPVVSVAAIATLLGLPLGIVVLLAMALLAFVGYAWGAFALGRAMVAEPRGRWLALLAGWAVLRAVALVPVLGGITFFAGSAYGFGAMTVAVWRTRSAAVPMAPVGARAGRHRPGHVPAEPEPAPEPERPDSSNAD